MRSRQVMERPDEVAPGLPRQFADPETGYALYEDVEYSDYWDDPTRERQDALEKRLIEDLLPTSGRRIIDVGCGFGRLAPCYIDRFDQVILLDGSLSLLRQARERLGQRAVFIAGDVRRLPFKAASFDAVLSIRVLQHIHELEATLAGMRRILPRDGQLVFSYHNKRNAHRILHYAQSKKVADPFSLESSELSPTLLSHHPARMRAALAGAGFTTPEYRGAVVLSSIAGITERRRRGVPSGLIWAEFTGKHELAPWLIGRSTANEGNALTPSTTIDDLLACPLCNGEVDRLSAACRCASCNQVYPVRDGILDFRVSGVGLP